MFKSSKPQSLETYLAQIAHELRDLPATARADEMREIESHLRAMIESRGDVAGVLAQFGKPRKVGRDLRRAWERKQPEIWWRAALALSLGLTIHAVFGLIAKEFYVSYLAYYGIDVAGAMAGSSKVTGVDSNSPAIFATIILYLQIFSIFTATAKGYTVGLISPKRGIVAALLIIIFYYLKEIVMTIHSPIGLDTSEAISGYITSFAVHFALSLVFVFIGAYFGARHSRKRNSRIADAK